MDSKEPPTFQELLTEIRKCTIVEQTLLQSLRSNDQRFKYLVTILQDTHLEPDFPIIIADISPDTDWAGTNYHKLKLIIPIGCFPCYIDDAILCKGNQSRSKKQRTFSQVAKPIQFELLDGDNKEKLIPCDKCAKKLLPVLNVKNEAVDEFTANNDNGYKEITVDLRLNCLISHRKECKETEKYIFKCTIGDNVGYLAVSATKFRPSRGRKRQRPFQMPPVRLLARVLKIRATKTRRYRLEAKFIW